MDFVTTDRLLKSNRRAMKPSHAVGNHVLSVAARALFGHGFRDSQSGMWILRREVWKGLDVRSVQPLRFRIDRPPRARCAAGTRPRLTRATRCAPARWRVSIRRSVEA
ncbi:MAG TPA: hypothetical protein VI248_04200 [Kineosporiaceae bacterium]